jgi:hypothetical protein
MADVHGMRGHCHTLYMGFPEPQEGMRDDPRYFLT